MTDWATGSTLKSDQDIDRTYHVTPTKWTEDWPKDSTAFNPIGLVDTPTGMDD